MPRPVFLAVLAALALGPGASAPQSTRSTAAAPDPGWLARVGAELERERHAFAADGAGGVRAMNSAHGISARIDTAGAAIEHERGAFALRLRGFGRVDELAPLAPAGLAFDARRAELDHGLLVEWWTNDAAGMEHGFDVPRPPAVAAEGPLALELALETDFELRLVDDGLGLSLRHAGHELLSYAKLAAFDADGAELEARMRLAPGALVLEVDDAGARYPITVDPLLASPTWSRESGDAFASFGNSVSTAGDVNGDGTSDVIVGAPLHDVSGLAWAGSVFLYLGSATGLGGWSWRANGTVSQNEFGKSVACAGDVNGDGFDDVIIGEPRASNLAGRAFLYYGNATGANLALGWTATGTQAQARFGQCVAYAGDVNADGFADVVVGSPVWDFLDIDDVGRADLFLGSAQGLASAPSWSVFGDSEDGELGTCVAAAGDVNGDGFDDVIVGEPGHPNGGRVQLFYGGPSGPGTTAGWAYSPLITPSRLGQSVATAGDVNRDGYADLLIGQPERTTAGGTQAGFVMLFLGRANGPNIQYDHGYPGTRAYETLGLAVATAGDVNGDGYADALMGAPGFGAGTTDGWARLYYGSDDGLEFDPEWVTSGGLSYAYSLATAGDVNGDGFADVVVGEPWYDNGQTDEGAVRVYHGSSGTPTEGDDEQGPQNGSGLGYSVANAGDVDGDGFDEVIVGAPRADVSFADAGYLCLYPGNADLELAPVFELHGDRAGAFLGISVAGAGDVNADGFDDVIAGASSFTNGEPEEGAAFIFHGSPAGIGPGYDLRLELDDPDAGLGHSVAGAGDVNGDGYADVIVGAPFTGVSNGSAHGRAYVFHGSAQGLDPMPAWSYDGDASQGFPWFGHSVAGAGDVNADGFSDVIVGEPYWSSGGASFAGRARVFLGSAQGLGSAPAWTTPLGNAQWISGYAVASAGDVNADGYADVIVGAPGYAPANNGRALVFHGSPTGPSPFWNTLVQPYTQSSQLGWSVAAAGDLDGDGYGDVLIGAPFALNGQGRAQVQFGSSSGLSPTADLWTDGAMQWGNLRGISVGGGGDFDGDGFPDLLVGAPDAWPGGADPGHFGIVAGNSSDAGLALRPRWPAQRQMNGVDRIALRARAKVPGTAALCVRAHSPAGRARVRLEWQLAQRGESFTGQTIERGSAWHDTGAPDAVESAVPVCELEDGLSFDEIYTWRARVASPNPLFPHGPWFSASGNSPTEGKLSTHVGQTSDLAGAMKQNP